MLNQKYFGLPVWVWIVISIIIAYSVYQSSNKTILKSEDKQENKLENTQEIKEKFANNKPIIKIFNFNTTWCGWSLRFQPEWDAFMEYVKNPENNLTHVEAVDIKCDNENNKKKCEEYSVPGFPYVIVEVNGSRSSYKGERTKDSLISFVSNI